MVAEVLSPTTAAIDTREKLQAYGAIESPRYYLLVESERAAVRYQRLGEEAATRHSVTIRSAADCGV